jgi:hypothetical protein
MIFQTPLGGTDKPMESKHIIKQAHSSILPLLDIKGREKIMIY